MQSSSHVNQSRQPMLPLTPFMFLLLALHCHAAKIRYVVLYWYDRPPLTADNFIHDEQANGVVEYMRLWSHGHCFAVWNQDERTVRVLNKRRASTAAEADRVLRDMATLVYTKTGAQCSDCHRLAPHPRPVNAPRRPASQIDIHRHT